MADKSPSRLSAVLQAANLSRGKRSPFYFWMKQNFRPLQLQFAEHGPRWKGLVKGLADAGLTDWNGQPPTIRTAQQTWYRLKRDMQTQALQPALPVPSKAALRPTAPPAPAPDTEARLRAQEHLASMQALMQKRSHR